MAFAANKPPWSDDPNPKAWVTLVEAAKAFRKDRETIRKLAVSGTLPSYFDGSCWYVRLDFNYDSSNPSK